jgi:hypothetical protein
VAGRRLLHGLGIRCLIALNLSPDFEWRYVVLRVGYRARIIRCLVG